MHEHDLPTTRDAVRVSVMRKAGIDRISSFDDGFDKFPNVERLQGRGRCHTFSTLLQ